MAERAALVRKVGELHAERRQELAEIIVREMGKPIEQALGEVDFAGEIYGFYADNAEDLMADEPIELLDGEGTAVIRRSPFGVLLGIMPWNFPYYQVARFAGPNLVIGNTILLKHAPQCPESAEAMQQIFDDAGFPEGAYENIYATNEQIEWVIADPRVHGVSVTGSERAGAAVAEIAGRNLKKVVLELGGSDPFILLGTDDLDAAAQQAAEARLDNTGQSCNAAKRFIVADELYDEFVEKFSEKLARREARRPDRRGHRRSARSPRRRRPTGSRTRSSARSTNGAEVVVGGKRDGNYFEPTILTGIEPGDEASQEEFFGPVAQVYRVGSEDEAVALANQTPVRPRLLPDDHRLRAGRAGRRQDRSRDGLRQPGRRRQPGAAVRRVQALRLRPRARPLRRRRVRQQEADPQRLSNPLVAGEGYSLGWRTDTA